MRNCLVLVAAFVAVTAAGAVELRPAVPAPATAPVVRISHCLVSLIDDVEVPAEKAGVLTSLVVREGDYLKQDAPIASIDEEQAVHQHDAAAADAEAARAKATNPLEVEYAVATHRTAEAEFRIALSANAKQANAVSSVELEKLRLAAEQARIKIGVTEFERSVRATEAKGFDAKAKLAAADVEQRKIHAPLAGQVVEVMFRSGEWVEPGKPIVRMVRLDRLRAEAFVKFAEHTPTTILGRDVQVSIGVAGGKIETFSGKVTFVNPIVQPGGEYRIWAEIENRCEQEQWLLRPGLEVEMVIGTVRP